MSFKQVVTELDVSQLKALQLNLTREIIMIKFGAEWCAPCKKIAPLYQAYIAANPPNILFCDIDVDTNLDLYVALKKQKMISGIPALFAFFGDVKRDSWFIPDDSVVGGDENEIKKFFKRCTEKSAKLLSDHISAAHNLSTHHYTYFS